MGKQPRNRPRPSATSNRGATSAKKVQRAARTGGGRTTSRSGRNTPWGWYGAMGVVVVVLLAIFVNTVSDSKSGGEHPQLLSQDPADHWHAAYGFDICGTWQQDLPQPANLIGLHTHGDGVIHVEAQTNADTGKHATVGRWASGEPGLKISSTSITLPAPDNITVKNGDACPAGSQYAGQKAEVRAAVDGHEVSGNPSKIRVRNGEHIAFAFLPKNVKIPDIPNADAKIKVANTGQTESNGATSTTVPGATPTTAPGATTTTTAPGATTTTAPGATTTTAAP